MAISLAYWLARPDRRRHRDGDENTPADDDSDDGDAGNEAPDDDGAKPTTAGKRRRRRRRRERDDRPDTDLHTVSRWQRISSHPKRLLRATSEPPITRKIRKSPQPKALDDE
jgi:hypothetical protein